MTTHGEEWPFYLVYRGLDWDTLYDIKKSIRYMRIKCDFYYSNYDPTQLFYFKNEEDKTLSKLTVFNKFNEYEI